MAAEPVVPVSLELGKRWVFATALDWPGWCRRGKGEQAALDVLLDYAGRYAAVAGPGFEPGEVQVVGRVTGNAITDFGAPDVPGPWDDEPLPTGEADRLTGLLEACWNYLDPVVAAAPEVPHKGPRGVGPDRANGRPAWRVSSPGGPGRTARRRSSDRRAPAAPAGDGEARVQAQGPRHVAAARRPRERRALRSLGCRRPSRSWIRVVLPAVRSEQAPSRCRMGPVTGFALSSRGFLTCDDAEV